MALKALKIIHSHNVLHNDIRKENILVNEKGNVYFIDFVKSIVTDKKDLFRQEESELSRLFDCYIDRHSETERANDDVFASDYLCASKCMILQIIIPIKIPSICHLVTIPAFLHILYCEVMSASKTI
ncbi:7849_t:CDS:2 [Funneliformis mosseae]|uniref:7849_t:CDS:1 n=1 Tax=Funneliformis mosseae TaxID=27381 RepID=A0A9N9HL43_FUNMO|nr:7849_t:CDS:2 [Funneliformis mosseae]